MPHATDQDILDALKDALLDWASGGIEKTVRVGVREYTYMDVDLVQGLIEKYEAKVALGGSTPTLGIKLFGVRFGKPK